jgi:hypothetical protein
MELGTGGEATVATRLELKCLSVPMTDLAFLHDVQPVRNSYKAAAAVFRVPEFRNFERLALIEFRVYDVETAAGSWSRTRVTLAGCDPMATEQDRKPPSLFADATGVAQVAIPFTSPLTVGIYDTAKVAHETDLSQHASWSPDNLPGLDSPSDHPLVDLSKTAPVFKSSSVDDVVPQSHHSAMSDILSAGASTNGGGYSDPQKPGQTIFGRLGEHSEALHSDHPVAGPQFASANIDHAGPTIAHGLFWVAEGSSKYLEPNPYATPHHGAKSDGAGLIDHGMLNAAEHMKATFASLVEIGREGRSDIPDPKSIAHSGTGESVRINGTPFMEESELLFEPMRQRMPGNRENTYNRMADEGSTTKEGEAVRSQPAPGPSVEHSHQDETPPSDVTPKDANKPFDHHPGEATHSTPIVSSGAAFWSVAVDRLDGSSHSSGPFYTAGGDRSFGSLTVSHLDQVDTLMAVLGHH